MPPAISTGIGAVSMLPESTPTEYTTARGAPSSSTMVTSAEEVVPRAMPDGFSSTTWKVSSGSTSPSSVMSTLIEAAVKVGVKVSVPEVWL